MGERSFLEMSQSNRILDTILTFLANLPQDAEDNIAFYACFANSIQRKPVEANNISGSEESSCLLLNTNIHYRVHKSTPLASILSQMYPGVLSCGI
jgi:hypothetical protein